MRRHLVQDLSPIDVANACHGLLVHEQQSHRRLALVHALPEQLFVSILAQRIWAQIAPLIIIQLCTCITSLIGYDCKVLRVSIRPQTIRAQMSLSYNSANA